MITVRKHIFAKRFGAWVLALAVVFAMTGWNPAQVNAAPRYNLSDTSIQLVDKAGNDQLLATWSYVENENEQGEGTGIGTFIDKETNEEVEIIKDFSKEENQAGDAYPSGETYDVSEYGCLPYAGLQGAFIPNRIVTSITVKGILIEDLIDYASDLADGIDLRGSTKIGMSASKDGHGDTFAYDEFYGLQRYYYPKFRTTITENPDSPGNGTFDTEGGIIVPNSIALVGYNDRTDDIASMIPNADSMNAWRLFVGLADGEKYGASTTDQSNPNYRTMGARATSNITNIVFEPVYNAITVAGAEASGTEGEEGFVYNTATAAVTTGDNYFKAAAGETVSLGIGTDAEHSIENVLVKDAEENSIEVETDEEDPGVYEFEMPKTAVTVTVETDKTACEFGEDGFCTNHSTVDYNPEAEAYTVSTKAQLKAIADAVNAGDDLSGKTVTLAKDIALDDNGKYTKANGTFGASGYPMTSDYYLVNEDAAIWTPIGTGTASGNNVTVGTPFAGTFDGAGHTVSGVYTDIDSSVQGLFGCLTGTVKDLTVQGCINAKTVAGGIAAYVNGGTIEGCTNEAVVFAAGGQQADSGIENGVSRGGAVGGIAGNVNTGSSITGCTNKAAIVCANTAKGGRVGGIIGLIDGADIEVTISQNSNFGKIDSYQYAGGIVGMNASTKANIDSCFNNGDITGYSSGSTYVGGIVSQMKSDVSNCYNLGKIEIINSGKAAHMGGIVSDFSGQTIANCFGLGSAAGGSSYGVICGTGYGSAASCKLVNCYYLDGLAGEDAANLAEAEGALTAMTAEEFASEDFVAAINGEGEAYQASCGHPVLTWQEPKEHTPNEAVKENEESTPYHDKYDSVVYCNDCGAVLSSESVDAEVEGAWDSTTWMGGLDFSWYDENDVKAEYHITTPAQWQAVAWICSEKLADLQDYKANTAGNVTDIKGNIPTQQNYFEGVKFYLDNDIDMGGIEDAEGNWSGPNYYPIGAECETDLGGTGGFISVFFGSFDGQGHYVNNIYCLRGTTASDQCAGLFGRVGQPDNDRGGFWGGKPYELGPITIENVGVTGFIKSGRSVGGIVGKTLHVKEGGVLIQNCVNKATVRSTQKKGVGGICGAFWNKPTMNNCYSIGTAGGGTPAGSIVGGNEGTITNVYATQELAVAGEKATSTASVTNGYSALDKTIDEMKSVAFATLLGEGFKADCGGTPVLAWEEAAAHTAADAEYVWADDYSSVTGTIVCSVCGAVIENETTTNITSEVTTKPSTTETGIKHYTAAFESASFTAEADEVLPVLTEEEIEARNDALEAVTSDIINANAALAQGQYSEESYQALKDAIDAANALFEDDTTTEADVNAAKAEIMKAWRTLEPVDQTATEDAKANRAAVNELAETLINVYTNVDETIYKPASYAAFMEIVKAADAALEDTTSTTEALEQANTDVLKAWKSMEKRIDISEAVVSGLSDVNYSGKAFTPAPAVALDGKTLAADTDYSVAYSKNKNAGTATVTVTGEGDYIGAATGTFKINKIKQSMTAKAKTKTVKLAKVKKAKQTVKKTITVKNAKGKVTYAKKSGSAKLTISKKGVVTVKKGTQKGTYKIKVKVKAAGNTNFKAATKVVTVKVKVK